MKEYKCDCGKSYFLGIHDAGSEQEVLRMCNDCIYQHEINEVELLPGFKISALIEKRLDTIEYHGPDLLQAVQYYFEALEEANGNGFIRKSNGHVLKKLKEAYGKATGQI